LRRASPCGRELLRFDPGYPEQTDGTSFPPDCRRDELMAGTYVIDNVPDPVPVRGPCDAIKNSGTFRFSFPSYTHAVRRIPHRHRPPGQGGPAPAVRRFRGPLLLRAQPQAESGKLKITGTWTLNRPPNQWARVLVHLPDHGAHTPTYIVHLGNGDNRQGVLHQRVPDSV
jgi:hypothetical protein